MTNNTKEFNVRKKNNTVQIQDSQKSRLELIDADLIKRLGPVTTYIQEKWNQNKWLGKSVSKYGRTPNDKGWYQHFENGSIYWSKETGAHEVHGAIREKWATLGWEQSFLGFPTTDESVADDGIGRYNHFQGGSIFWTPDTGACEVHGAILEKWASLGREMSFLGYPISDELSFTYGSGRYNNFQKGQIAWSPSLGAAVSATSYEPQDGSGLTPQGVGVGPDGVPEVRRLVHVDGRMYLTDDENWASNEHSDTPFSKEAAITRNNTQPFLMVVAYAGGELRVELKLDVTAYLNGDVKVTGDALLYEGTSDTSDDLDGRLPIDFLVPRDNSITEEYTVYNQNEGGDSGYFKMTFSNFAVEP